MTRNTIPDSKPGVKAGLARTTWVVVIVTMLNSLLLLSIIWHETISRLIRSLHNLIDDLLVLRRLGEEHKKLAHQIVGQLNRERGFHE